MRNKSLIFLALVALSLVGCNKETTSVNAASTEPQKEVVAADVGTTVVEEAPAPAPEAPAPEAPAPEAEANK